MNSFRKIVLGVGVVCAVAWGGAAFSGEEKTCKFEYPDRDIPIHVAEAKPFKTKKSRNVKKVMADRAIERRLKKIEKKVDTMCLVEGDSQVENGNISKDHRLSSGLVIRFVGEPDNDGNLPVELVASCSYSWKTYFRSRIKPPVDFWAFEEVLLETTAQLDPKSCTITIPFSDFSDEESVEKIVEILDPFDKLLVKSQKVDEGFFSSDEFEISQSLIIGEEEMWPAGAFNLLSQNTKVMAMTYFDSSHSDEKDIDE